MTVHIVTPLFHCLQFIAPHSYAIVMVQLMPLPASDVDHEIDCIGFALGYMSVDGKVLLSFSPFICLLYL